MTKLAVVDQLHPLGEPLKLVDVEAMTRAGFVYARWNNYQAAPSAYFNVDSFTNLGNSTYRWTFTNVFATALDANSKIVDGEHQTWNATIYYPSILTSQVDGQSSNKAGTSPAVLGICGTRLDELA